jgi:hypothetical protein
MASVSDIRGKPKFFQWKKNYKPDNLCELCKQHKYIIAVKWGCDWIIYTDLLITKKKELGTKLHAWCEEDGVAPNCFKEYQDKGYVPA